MHEPSPASHHSPPPAVRAQSLSVCMIVKNEEAILARCLAGAARIADEIIVVDTGSTDTSRDIARSFGATVVEEPWQGDFSRARNASLNRATCAWILWLDADDVVPESAVVPITALKKTPANRVLSFRIRNEKPGGTGSDFVQARMFPNRPDIRFERRIHEQITLSAFRAGLALEQVDVRIEHHGYADPSTVKKKAQRNIDMLLTEFDAAHPDPVMAIEIADACCLAGDDTEAERWYTVAANVPDVARTLPDVASHALLGLGRSLSGRGRHDEAVVSLRQALDISPDRPDALYSLAVALEKLGLLDEAGTCLRRIIDGTEKPMLVSIDFREARIKAFLRMERILCLQGRPSDALANAHEALRELQQRPEIHSLLGRAQLRTGSLLDALHAFEKSLSIAAEGNLDAMSGLCVVYVCAGRRDNARMTLGQLLLAYQTYPRYWALVTMVTGSTSYPRTLNPNDIAEEESYLRLLYPPLPQDGQHAAS